jgi:hypothetical protein
VVSADVAASAIADNCRRERLFPTPFRDLQTDID